MENGKQTLDEATVEGVIRPYLTMDLLWLQPIAEKYNEWPDLLESLTYGVAAFVIKPYAMGMIFYDEHGLRFGGLTDKKGIKHFIKIGRMMVAGARATETDLHGHWEDDSWRARLGESVGFVLNGQGYHVLK